MYVGEILVAPVMWVPTTTELTMTTEPTNKGLIA
jgi:hypothetical protein